MAGLCWDWRFMTAPASGIFPIFRTCPSFNFDFLIFGTCQTLNRISKPSAVWLKERGEHQTLPPTTTNFFFFNISIEYWQKSFSPLLLLLFLLLLLPHLPECFVSPGTRPDSSALTSPSYSHATGNVFSFFLKKEMIKHFLLGHDSHCGAWICLAL